MRGFGGGAPDGRSADALSPSRPQLDERLAGEREMTDREAVGDREITDDERFEMFVAQHMQSVLPNLPSRPGYHVCWLTTSNPRDSIPNRMRAGYRLLRIEDVPGWDGITSKVGDKEGIVCVNEMVAAEIPLALYNRYMRYMHYTLPLQEEQKLRAQVESIAEDAARHGARVLEGDGMADLVQRAAPMEAFDS